jgi:hypothetical protein
MARRLTVHRGPQNAIDARLIKPAGGLQPGRHVGIETDGEFVFRRGYGSVPFVKNLSPSGGMSE